LHTTPSEGQEEAPVDPIQITPATQELNTNLRSMLARFFPRPTPLSVLLLHVSQLEHIHITPESAILHKRHRYHAPVSFLEQVLVNLRRAIRASDPILMHEGTGAAIILPDVDQQGAYRILERVYRHVSLLQAETVIPPLKRETDILMAIGSYPEPGSSLEHLLYYAGLTIHSLTLRPAITTQLRSTQLMHTSAETTLSRLEEQNTKDDPSQSRSVPFMQLPRELPGRLKQLIPYQIALELHCAPVGRDHHCLTVAMADPTNAQAIRHLRETTGMTIFPVSCEVTALNALLVNEW